MATASVKTEESYVQDDNLETFGLLWLDAQINATEENRQAQQDLRQIINHLRIFDNQNECQQYILSVSSQNRLILIVSGRLGHQIVPHIHQLRQLSSIYVYCMDKKTNEKWTKNFTKVKGVIVRLKDVIDQIKSDQKSRVKIEEPLSFNIFSVTDNPDQSTTGLNGHFLHSLLLIDALLRMKSVEIDKQQLISICKNEYKGNKAQLAILREFEQDYSSDKALWWYTRESFLYKMLNKALRVQNIDLLFLFRFVIGDIYQQLKEHQCQPRIEVYRGQVMSSDELNNLRESIGEFISINSFFSTSTNRHKALGFLNSSEISDDLHRVLFEVEADPHVVTMKPFADISSLSYFDDESEVLFMIGCIFRITDVRQDADQIWIIRIKLCGDDEHDMKNLFRHMKEEYGGGDDEVDLWFFGNVLREMGKFDLAEKIYQRLITELPPNDPSLFNLYYSLGTVTYHKGDYDSSLEWRHKALEIKRRTNSSDYISIGSSYNCIGEVHLVRTNYNEALEWFKKGIEVYKQANDEDHPNMAYFYNDIAAVYYSQKKYSEALNFYEKSLIIREKHLPTDHSNIGASHTNIGGVHLCLAQYDLAMEHYHHSLKIQLKSLPPQHPSIARTYEGIGTVHQAKSDLKQALVYYQKAATICRHSLPSGHPDVLRIESQIQGVSLALK